MDLTTGFLPAQDPLQKLPDEFAALDQIGADLPKLLLSNQLRPVVQKLPPFAIEQITDTAVLERLMMILSFLGHAYVWGALPMPSRIPASLARPWCAVAKKLARPPVLSYSSYALHNWRRIDPAQPIALGNIVLLQNFLGGMDEEWFVLVHVDIENKAITALQAVVAAQLAVQNHDSENLAKQLENIVIALTAMCDTLDRMSEHCDPYIYYQRVRPYIHGWKDNPALPDGLIYEGVAEFNNQPQKFRGETGAQSSIIPTLDAALNIIHKPDPLRLYLQEMRDYMPVDHRNFISSIEQGPSIRNYVAQSHKQFLALRDSYNACIELISRFRTTHLSYAARYIQKQHQTSLANPTETGTGGTPFMQYLKKHRDEAEEYRL